MKTLQQVEPRIPIGAVPFTITEPGSYYLTTNLYGGGGITISASRVSLDLMGFELAGGTGSGISVSGGRSNLWIRNGAVNGWSAYGVDAASAEDCVFEQLLLSGNANGLRAGKASVIRNCVVTRNSGAGIEAVESRCRIEANHLALNDRGLLVTGIENIIIKNTASGNTIDYDVGSGNDLGPVGSAASLSSPWGNIGSPLFELTVSLAGDGGGVVTSSPAGINCGMDCAEQYPAGTTVTLTAAPAPSGSVFTGWSGGGCSGVGSCVVTMDMAKSVTATFSLPSFTLTVTKAGTGTGTITSSPAGINCGVDCSEDYASGTMVSLSASAGPGSTFVGWSGACTGTGGCIVTMDMARSVTATFTLDSYTLTVTRAGAGTGTVTSSPAGINCGVDCTESYNSGTMVTLMASPASGSVFTGWSGGGCSGTGTCVVSMTAAQSVTASFGLSTFGLSVSRAGAGTGTVTSSPAGINCGVDCTEDYTSGTTVTLTASPAANSTFSGWSGDCTGTGSCIVSMNSPRSVTAMFSVNTFNLTVARAGTGTGTVTSSPAGINCGADCVEAYNHGTTVTLNASPASGSTFAGWSGGGCSGTGTCVVTVDMAKTVTAMFNSL